MPFRWNTPNPNPLDFPRAAGLARQVIEQILAHRPAAGSLFNVNIPSLERGPVRGIRTMPQNVAPYRETFDRRVDPRGRVYFWSHPGLSCQPHPDTDVTALEEGYITVTPLQFNLTHQHDAGGNERLAVATLRCVSFHWNSAELFSGHAV